MNTLIVYVLVIFPTTAIPDQQVIGFFSGLNISLVVTRWALFPPEPQTSSDIMVYHNFLQLFNGNV